MLAGALAGSILPELPRLFVLLRSLKIKFKVKGRLGEGNLIFCCTDPTDPNFQKIKIIIIVISHINIFDVYYLFFF